MHREWSQRASPGPQPRVVHHFQIWETEVRGDPTKDALVCAQDSQFPKERVMIAISKGKITMVGYTKKGNGRLETGAYRKLFGGLQITLLDGRQIWINLSPKE